MRAPIPHLVILALPLLLGACAASMPSGPPMARAPQQAPRCPSPVVVGAGDTVYSVARRCGVSVRELIETNHLQPPFALVAGSRLAMPGERSDYVVRKGDTLLVLARRYHVEFQSLAAANGKTPPYTLRVGETLRIPSAYGGGGSPTSATQASPSPAPARSSPPPVAREALAEREAPPPPRPAGVTASAPAPAVPLGAAPPPPPPPAPAPAPVAVPEPGGVSGRGFLWPVKGEVLVDFGPQAAKGQNNDGINIAAARGTPILAAENGVVAYVGNELKGFGNLVLIKHADGWVSAYAHADQVSVKRGETVRRGQAIATVGATGSVTAPQLHFELRRGTEAVNPTKFLRDGPV